MHRIPLTACALSSVLLVALHARAQQPAPKPQSSAGSWAQPAAPPAPAGSAQAAPAPAPRPSAPAAAQPERPAPRGRGAPPPQAAPPDQGAPADQGAPPPGYYTQPWYGPPEYAGQSGYYAPPAYGPPPGYYPPPGYGPPPGYYAQPVYGPPPYVPVGPDPAKVHNHDGFYLRMSFGVGYMHDNFRYETSSASLPTVGSDLKLSGGAVAFDVLVGGTPAAGLVFGGGILGAVAPNPNVTSGGVSAPYRVDLNLVMVAGFVDWYPNSRDGFHLQGLAGIAGVSTTDSNGDNIRGTNRNPAGIGLGLGVGYEWWIGNQWSMGVLGRVLYAHATVTDTYIDGSGMYDETEKHSVIAPAVLFTATYH